MYTENPKGEYLENLVKNQVLTEVLIFKTSV